MDITDIPIIPLRNLEEGLRGLGIKREKISSVESLSDLNPALLSERQRGQLKYAPKTEVLKFEGNEDLWFRSNAKDWATTFVLLPGDLVLLISEYAAGADIVVVASCAGVPDPNESFADCAKREVEEESGVILERVVPLSQTGLPISLRKSTERVYPFVGIPLIKDGQVVCKPSKDDPDEKIKPFLMTLQDYWEFISSERFNNSVTGRDCAYAALRYLGRIGLTA